MAGKRGSIRSGVYIGLALSIATIVLLCCISILWRTPIGKPDLRSTGFSFSVLFKLYGCCRQQWYQWLIQLKLPITKESMKALQRITDYPLGERARHRAMVMISGLASVTRLRSQSPYCASIWKSALVKNRASEPKSTNLKVLRLSCGLSQTGLLNMLVNETISPSTGVSTLRVNRINAPVRSMISAALSKVQVSHSRTSGLRVSNTKHPSSVRDDRIAAKDAWTSLSSMNT
jgi:hypothetical protein